MRVSDTPIHLSVFTLAISQGHTNMQTFWSFFLGLRGVLDIKSVGLHLHQLPVVLFSGGRFEPECLSYTRLHLVVYRPRLLPLLLLPKRLSPCRSSQPTEMFLLSDVLVSCAYHSHHITLLYPAPVPSQLSLLSKWFHLVFRFLQKDFSLREWETFLCASLKYHLKSIW